MGDNPDVFEGHKRYAGVREFPKPDWEDGMSEAEIAELKKRIAVDESPLVWEGQLLENGLIVGNWKLIEVGNNEYELYDLHTDPEEKNNLANQKSEVRGNMAGFYRYWKEKEEKK